MKNIESSVYQASMVNSIYTSGKNVYYQYYLSLEQQP